MVWAVYIVTNKANGKQYVGITKNVKRRWHQHLSANGSAPALHAAIKKYGRKHSEETKAKIRASNIATKALLKAKRLSEQGVENA